MKQVLSGPGGIVVEEIPAPVCGENQVLVRNMYSLISVGTELSSIKNAEDGNKNPLLRAIEKPELVTKAVNKLKNEGLGATIKAIRGQGRLNLTALGYSSAGIAIEVGRDIKDIAVGDLVACAGAGIASHAEIVAVPRNLLCKVPPGVEAKEAAFVTLGAIAMQGVRQAKVQFGDNVAVMGLGLLGQIGIQILNAAGCHVIGIDLMEDRVRLGLELGMEKGISDLNVAVDEVLKFTQGYGADAVIIYAATPSSEPVRQAMQMARRKGRVVVVGAVGMDLERSPFYEKELDFTISCSYGPGRYDRNYEQKGIDYPYGYVRWTENRNMQEFLSMIKTSRVNLKPLINLEFSLNQAPEAYKSLQDPELKPLGVLFKYEETHTPWGKRAVYVSPRKTVEGKIRTAVIGAGGFAQEMHLPNLKQLKEFEIRAVVSGTGVNAKKVAGMFNAGYCTTDYREVLEDPDVDMVIIATRHNLHAQMVIEAAKAGKHIFVEKPIAMTADECKAVEEALEEYPVHLTVGFNRRFAPLAQQVKKILEHRNGPLFVNYRVNSAGMKADHWINDPVEGGGAIIGEGCHFIDFFNWLTGSEPKDITARMLSSGNASIVDANNVAATLTYTDGSLACLQYVTIGHPAFPKERVEIFVDGGVILLDDFKELSFTGISGQNNKLSRIEKGQMEMMEAFGKLLKGVEHHPDLPDVSEGVKATLITLKINELLGKPVTCQAERT